MLENLEPEDQIYADEFLTFTWALATMFSFIRVTVARLDFN